MEQNTNRIGDLVVPSSEDIREAWPVFGSLLLMAGLYAGRKLMSDDPEADYLSWGAYEKEQTLRGQWWRVVTYSFVYENVSDLVGDAAAIALCGTALTRRQSSSVAFATFRLGLFVGLLSLVFDTPRDKAVTSVSGPAYCMLGALLMNLARGEVDWTLDTNRDRLAAGALSLTTLTMAARLLFAPKETRRARIFAMLAGAGATNLASVVSFVEKRQAKRTL